MMIPSQATVIPLFKLMSNFELLNTYFALIVPQLCYPFAIFLMRQNFMAFPSELLESARLDGAGEYRIFFPDCTPIDETRACCDIDFLVYDAVE